MKIAILDWGIGGCGLVSRLQGTGIDIVYLSDSGFEPYGKVPKIALRERIMVCLDYLETHKPDLVAVACNAASSVIEANDSVLSIIDHAQSILVELPTNQKIGVIGGYRLVDSKLLGSKTFPDHQIKQVVAQKLSAHIEAGNQDTLKASDDLQNILNDLGDIDHLILACTHYSAMEARIKTLRPSLKIHDPVIGMAHVIQRVNNFSNKTSRIEWFTTGSKEAMKKSAKLAFNVDISEVDQIIL